MALAIDKIDRQVIALFGIRYKYVIAAAKFKTSETAVKAPDRFKSMLHKRRAWTQEEGLDSDVIEKLYRDLVTNFIEKEMAHYKSLGR